MLAFITLHQKEWMKHSYVALCSVSERAILHRLKVNKNIKKVVLCLDHDNAGIAACVRIKDILLQNGYANKNDLETRIVTIYPSPKPCKNVSGKAVHQPASQGTKRVDTVFVPNKPKTGTAKKSDDGKKGDCMPIAQSNITAHEETEILINVKGDIVDERIRKDIP